MRPYTEICENLRHYHCITDEIRSCISLKLFEENRTQLIVNIHNYKSQISGAAMYILYCNVISVYETLVLGMTYKRKFRMLLSIFIGVCYIIYTGIRTLK